MHLKYPERDAEKVYGYAIMGACEHVLDYWGDSGYDARSPIDEEVEQARRGGMGYTYKSS